MKSISIDSNSILDMSTKKPMSEIIDFSKEYVTTETDKDTVYKAGDGINISSDNTISIDQGDSAAVEPADATTAGIMKLYGETGANSDGTMTQESITDELSSKAPTASPTFTGTPTAPTPSSSDTGSDRIATTAYVLSLLKNNPEIIDDILTALDGKLNSTIASSTYLTKTEAANLYATKNNPVFTGNMTVGGNITLGNSVATLSNFAGAFMIDTGTNSIELGSGSDHIFFDSGSTRFSLYEDTVKINNDQILTTTAANNTYAVKNNPTFTGDMTVGGKIVLGNSVATLSNYSGAFMMEHGSTFIEMGSNHLFLNDGSNSLYLNGSYGVKVNNKAL